MVSGMLRMVFFAIAVMTAPLLSLADQEPSSRSGKTFVGACVAMEPWRDAISQTSVYCSFLSELGREAGIDIESMAEPLPRAIASLRNGSADVTMLAEWDNRDGAGIELCTRGRLKLLLAFRKGDDEWRTLSPLKGKRFAAPDRAHNFERFIAAGAVREPVNTMTQGFKMLEAGRVDAVACALPGCEQAMRDAHSDPAALDFIQVDEAVLFVLIPRSSSLAADAAAMRRLQAACEMSPPDGSSIP